MTQPNFDVFISSELFEEIGIHNNGVDNVRDKDLIAITSTVNLTPVADDNIVTGDLPTSGATSAEMPTVTPIPEVPAPKPSHQIKSSAPFPELSEADLVKLEGQVNAKTTKSNTSWAVKRLKEGSISRGLDPNFEMLSVEELSQRLRRFYGEIRKKDGECYGKNALSGLRSALHRHITGPPFHRTCNIISGAEFKSANNVLLGVVRLMKREGKDVTKSYDPISPEDMQRLMSSGVFGVHHPQKLQDLVWFSIQFYLCRRGCEGNRELKRDSFQIINKPEEVEYVMLRYNEHSKNHPGGFKSTNDPKRRLHATGGPMCPVAAIKLYLSLLNPGCDAFYQRVDSNWRAHPDCWFMAAPLGEKKINSMMGRIGAAAKLSRHYTNHCIRASCIKTLMDSGYDPITVTRLSGHRNVASVMSYCRDTTASVKQQMGATLTAALHGPPTPPSLPSVSRPALPSSSMSAPPSTMSAPPPGPFRSALPSQSASTASAPPQAFFPRPGRPALPSTSSGTGTSCHESAPSSSGSSAICNMQSNRQLMSSVFNNCTIHIESFVYGQKQ